MRSVVFRSCWLAASALVAVAGAFAACTEGDLASLGSASGSETPDATASGRPVVQPGEDPVGGVDMGSLTQLATAPTFNSGTGVLTITIAPGELGMVALRSIDSAIIVNGYQAVDPLSTPVPATSTTVTSISVVESAASDAGLLTTELIVDYTNGVFAKGLTGNGGSIRLAFNGSEPTILGIKGTATADTITFGATGVNVNADAYPDIVFGGSAANGGAGTFVVSMGIGDDTWYSGGDSATSGDSGTARFNNDAPLNPAAGYGPGVVVYGGLGNDTFSQGATATPYETLYGGGQSGDTIDYSQRTNGVNVTLSVPGIANIVSGDCVAPGGEAGVDAGDGGLAAGAGCVTDEWDDVKNDVFIVNGGSGNDFITASPTALVGGAPVVDAGAGEAGAGDAGHSDAGAGDAGHPDAGDAGASDAGHPDAGDAGASDAGHPDSGAASDAGASDAGAGPVAMSTVFNGNAGNDTLTPYGGPYVMNGGSGNDTFVMGLDSQPHGAGTLNGGAGIDYVDFSARTAALKLVLDGATKSGTMASGVVTENMVIGADIENVHAGAGADTIVGNALDNVINGGPGTDTMTGNGGNDTVDYSDRTGPVYVALDGLPHSGTAGTFTRTPGTAPNAYTDGSCSIGSSSTENDTVMPDFQNILGSQGDDCLFGQPVGFACTGTVCQNNLVGGPGNDMLFGNDDDDILEGSGGAGDSNAASNQLDCGGGYANTGHDIGVTPAGYKANCQF